MKKICPFFVSGFDDEDRPSDDPIININIQNNFVWQEFE